MGVVDMPSQVPCIIQEDSPQRDFRHVRYICFLDVDGVLNSKAFFDELYPDGEILARDPQEELEAAHYGSAEWWAEHVDPEPVKLLNELARRVAEVYMDEALGFVMISRWRLNGRPRFMENVLREKGFEGWVIGATEHTTLPRISEIHRWLVRNRWVKGFVVIDDKKLWPYGVSEGVLPDRVSLNVIRGRHVQPVTENGMVRADLDKAIEILSP